MHAAKKANLDSKILQELVPLNALSPERFKEVSEKIVVEEVKSGRYLFRKGDRDNQSIYLLDGKINLIDGFRKVASEVESGSDISRYPISNMQPRTVSARAAKKSIIARIDSSLLDAFLTWDQSNSAEAVEISADDNSDWMTRMLQSEAFMRIPPAMIQSLLMKMQPVEVAAGDTIISQGSDGDYFYTIHEGRCAVTRRDADSADEQLLAELEPGDSFGEEALVSDTKRNATVSMLTDGVLMRLAKKDFVALLQEPLVRRISYEAATALVDEGAVWVDVRTPDEYESSSFEDSVNIPLADLRGEIPELVFNAKYVICCDTGRRSGSAAFMLSHKGFDVYVLEGGIDSLGTVQSGREQLVDGEFCHDGNGQVVEAVDYDDGLQEAADTTAVGDGTRDAVIAGDTQSAVDTASATAITDLEMDVATLRARNDSLCAELEQSRSVEARLTGQLELLREELGESAEKLATFYAREKTDTDEKQQLREEHARLQEEYTRRLRAVQTELQAVRQQQQDNAADGRQDLQADVQQLQQDLAEARSQVQTLNNELSAARVDGESQQHEHTAVLQELQEYRGRSVELEARVASLEQELQDGREELERLTADAAEEREALQRRIHEIGSKDRQDDERLSAALAEHEAADLRIKSLEQEVEELRFAMSEAGAKLQEQIEQAETMATGRQAAEEALQQLQADLEAEREGRNDDTDAMHQTIDNLRTELVAAHERAAAEKATLEEQLQQLQLEKNELLELQHVHSGQAGELQDERDNLQNKLSEHAEENSRLQEEIATLRDQLATLGASADELQSLQQLTEDYERSRQVAQESQDAIRKADEELARKNENEKQLQVQVERLRKKLEQASLQQQLLRDSAQKDVDNIRDELHAERQARAEERAEMAARQRELKEQLAAVASEHETNLNNQSGALEEAKAAARDEERARMQGMLEAQHQAEEQLQKMHAELQQAHAEIARLDRQEKERCQAGSDLLQEQSSQAEAAVEQLESRLRQLTEERDQLLEEQQDLHERLNVLRGEVEVARGLIHAGKDSDIEEPVQSQHELDEIRGDGEISEQQCGTAEVSVDQLEGSQVVELPLQVPSLDVDDEGADAQQAEHRGIASDPTDDEADADMSAMQEGDARRGYGWLGRLLGVAMVGLSALMFWLMLGIQGGGQHSGSASDEAAAPDIEPEAATTRFDTVEEEASADPQASPVAAQPPAPPIQPVTATDESKVLVRGTVVQPATSVTSAVPAVQTEGQAERAAAPKPVQTAGPDFRDNLGSGGKGPVMTELPGASFMMGSLGNSLNFDEGPRHQVTLPGFSISKHEVTFADYDRFARTTGRRLPHDEGWGRGDRPVINVSWHDARAYAAWLSKQTGKSYRLPTESEWEYAVRAGSTGQHWWETGGDAIPANCFDCGSRWDGYRTAPVGSFAANDFGLHDMAGNVQEWTQDCYRAGYADAPVDGSARLIPECTQRVVRGGAYTSPQDSLRSARRGQYDQETRLDNLGFRVVRDN